MERASKKAVSQKATIEEIKLDDFGAKELDQLAEETRKCGISWKDLKAELGI